MKALLLTFSLLFLFYPITKADVVLDSNGKPLLPGVPYYIYPFYWGPLFGGGVLPGKAGNSTYQTAVLRSGTWNDYGKPVKFLPLTKIGIITTDAKLSVEFVDTPEGVSSGKWIAVKDLGDTWTVGIGGAEDHEGYETKSGFFHIKEAEMGYKLSFLPNLSNSSFSAHIVDEYDHKKIYRLVLSSDLIPFMVVFVKGLPERSLI